MATALCQICFLQFRISRQVAFLLLDKGPLAYRRIALTNIKIHWYSFYIWVEKGTVRLFKGHNVVIMPRDPILAALLGLQVAIDLANVFRRQ